jgi:hypothetical protein
MKDEETRQCSEEIWKEFSLFCPEVLDVVQYPFSQVLGEPSPAIPRNWTVRMLVYMAMEGYCDMERALLMIWDLMDKWND